MQCRHHVSASDVRQHVSPQHPIYRHYASAPQTQAMQALLPMTTLHPSTAHSQQRLPWSGKCAKGIQATTKPTSHCQNALLTTVPLRRIVSQRASATSLHYSSLTRLSQHDHIRSHISCFTVAGDKRKGSVIAYRSAGPYPQTQLT
jgi:hypothetical protein